MTFFDTVSQFYSTGFSGQNTYGTGYFDFANQSTKTSIFGSLDFSFSPYYPNIPDFRWNNQWFNFSTPATSSKKTQKTDITTTPTSSDISNTAYNLALKGYKNLKDKGNGYLGIVDPNTNSYYLYDMKGDKPKLIGSTTVKFGSGNMDAVANANISGSHATLSGFTKVAEEYSTPKWSGIGIRFDGLEQGINNNARAKATVIHCKESGSTWGCIGVTPEYKNGKVDNYATNDKIRRLFPKGTIMFTCPTNAGMDEYKRLSALV